jgi:hypothetical protein
MTMPPLGRGEQQGAVAACVCKLCPRSRCMHICLWHAQLAATACAFLFLCALSALDSMDLQVLSAGMGRCCALVWCGGSEEL